MKNNILKIVDETEKELAKIKKSTKGALEADVLKTVRAIAYEKIKTEVRKEES